MSRISRLVAVLLLAVLCLPLMSSSLLDEDSMTGTQNAYTTAEVVRGSFVRSVTISSAFYYPVVEDVRCLARSARLGRIAIGRSSKVTEGMELGEIVVEASRTDLTSARLTLARMREQYEAGRTEREAALRSAQDTLSGGADQREAEILRLRLEKQRLQLEQYQLEQAYAISAQEKAVAELEESMEGMILTSPVTGEIETYSYLNEGDSLSYGQLLLSIRRTDTYLLRVEDGDDRFRYGMTVTVQYGPRNARQETTARIVSADNVRRYNDTTGYAYALLDTYIPYEDLSAPSLSTEYQRVDGVLLIPRKAARLSAGKQMVSLLDGASIADRYINVALNNTEYYWVLQGLEEGQILVLD